MFFPATRNYFNWYYSTRYYFKRAFDEFKTAGYPRFRLFTPNPPDFFYLGCSLEEKTSGSGIRLHRCIDKCGIMPVGHHYVIGIHEIKIKITRRLQSPADLSFNVAACIHLKPGPVRDGCIVYLCSDCTITRIKMNRGKRRTALSIDIHESASHEESFIANGEIFIKDNVAINSTGIAMRDNPKTFTLVYDEIEMGDMIGRGSSSIVLHGMHSPTNTPLALKIINLFDKSKREQLIREIITLYDAQCPNLITFYGAFYREGSFKKFS